MKLSLICFTESGRNLCLRLMEGLGASGHDCRGFVPPKFISSSYEEKGLEPMSQSLGEWTKQQFAVREGLVFIGAAGIAVRAIAPWIRDKTADPAVVVLDDAGQFSISLLSGHLGGANGLAKEAAAIVGGIPVITTATDIHGRFAVDEFAKKRSMWISDMNTAKLISADILAGEEVGIFSDFPMEGTLPLGVKRESRCKRNIWITVGNGSEEGSFPAPAAIQEEAWLRLIPGQIIAGVGCRKGIDKEDVKQAVWEAARRCGIDRKSVFALATIDWKKEEAGLVEFADEAGLSFHWFSAKKLQGLEGEFTSSSFVKRITGVDNVCERAACCLAEEMGGGRLVMKKQAGGGVTVAFAVRDWKVKL